VAVLHFVWCVVQVKAMLNDRREQLEKKLLRSRQRTNYELLQERFGLHVNCTADYHGNHSCVVYADVSRLLVHIVVIQVIKSHHHDDHQKIIR